LTFDSLQQHQGRNTRPRVGLQGKSLDFDLSEREMGRQADADPPEFLRSADRHGCLVRENLRMWMDADPSEKYNFGQVLTAH